MRTKCGGHCSKMHCVKFNGHKEHSDPWMLSFAAAGISAVSMSRQEVTKSLIWLAFFAFVIKRQGHSFQGSRGLRKSSSAVMKMV